MRSYWLIPGLYLSISLSAQEYSKTQVYKDLQFLKQSIESYQPTLDLYNANFSASADSMLATLDSEMDQFEYFQSLSELIHLAQEGHFAVGQWEDTIHSGFAENRYRYLPLGVYIIQDRLFVAYDISDDPRLSKGDEILSINGEAVANIINQLAAQIPSDGNIATYPIRKLEKEFNWRFYLGYDQPEEFKLEIRKENLRMAVDLRAITREKMVENAKAVRAKKNSGSRTENADPMSRFYEFTITDSIAVLKLKGFSRSTIEELNLKAAKFYKDIFEQIAENNTQVLVIDVRGNNGGRLEFVGEILPYITQNQTSQYYRQSISWEGKKRSYKLPKPSKLLFEGQIFVLVDGLSFSGGSSIARHLREYGNAIIIGEETGSRYQGFAAGSKEYVYLPNSKMRIGIPRYSVEYPNNLKQDSENRGVLPDIPIERNITDIFSEKDPWMDAVYQALEK